MASVSDLQWEQIAPEVDAVSSSNDPLHALASHHILRCFLESAANVGAEVLILVNDPYRSTKTRDVLSIMAGMSGTLKRLPNFACLVATGTHVFGANQRLEFESETIDGCGLPIRSVTWHDAHDAAALVELGGTHLNRCIAEHRFLLPIGSVEPHYFAGLTGPHKTATIGCMGARDIERNHESALRPESAILKLAGNPVFDGITSVIENLRSSGKILCAIGEVVCRETITAAAVGDPLEVVSELAPASYTRFVREVERPVDVIRLRVPSPLGKNLYQADKALKNNERAVRDGGGIVLDAQCPEGIGTDSFLSLLERAGDYSTARRIVAKDGYRLCDHKAVKLLHLVDPRCRNVLVALVSPAIASAGRSVPWMKVFSDFDPALSWLAERIPSPFKRGLMVEDAGNVCVLPAEIDVRPGPPA